MGLVEDRKMLRKKKKKGNRRRKKDDGFVVVIKSLVINISEASLSPSTSVVGCFYL